MPDLTAYQTAEAAELAERIHAELADPDAPLGSDDVEEIGGDAHIIRVGSITLLTAPGVNGAIDHGTAAKAKTALGRWAKQGLGQVADPTADFDPDSDPADDGAPPPWEDASADDDELENAKRGAAVEAGFQPEELSAKEWKAWSPGDPVPQRLVDERDRQNAELEAAGAPTEG
jgi:hypothetical protein